MTAVKRTPDEALKAVQTLWPHVRRIRKPPNGTHVCWDCGGTSAIEVEWPKGVTEWPKPDKGMEGTRQAKMPEDLYKEALFRDSENGVIIAGQLVGRVPSSSADEYGWICHSSRMSGLTRFKLCFVKDDSPKPEPVLSKSNPGEGYRLIDKAHDIPEPGDQFWSVFELRWKDRSIETDPWGKSDTYRRAIKTQHANGITASPGYRLLDKGELLPANAQMLVVSFGLGNRWLDLSCREVNSAQHPLAIYQVPINPETVDSSAL